MSVYVGVAQLVEHRTHKPGVVGSIPTSDTLNIMKWEERKCGALSGGDWKAFEYKIKCGALHFIQKVYCSCKEKSPHLRHIEHGEMKGGN